jgi:hypothetical protein
MAFDRGVAGSVPDEGDGNVSCVSFLNGTEPAELWFPEPAPPIDNDMGRGGLSRKRCQGVANQLQPVIHDQVSRVLM